MGYDWAHRRNVDIDGIRELIIIMSVIEEKYPEIIVMSFFDQYYDYSLGIS